MKALFRSSWNLITGGAVLVALVLVSVLFAEMVRSERAHQKVTDSALTDYAEVAAWQYVRRTEFDLQSSLGPALGTLRDSPPEMDIDRLHQQAIETASRCPCPHGTRPELTFRFDGDAFEYSGDESLADWDQLRAHLEPELKRFNSDSSRTLAVNFLPFNGQPIAVAHVTTQSSSPRITGYLAHAEPVKDTLTEGFKRHDLLPATLIANKTQSDVMTLRVRGAGQVFFESGPLEGPWQGRADFDLLTEMFAGLSVETALQPAATELLHVGGSPHSRMPLLAALAGLSLLLGLVAAWQLLRERRLVRMRTDTIARISHELRTPLAQIRLFTETLKLNRARDSRERERALSVIDRESRRLDHLVNNVLRFSRRSSDSERLNQRIFSLEPFLNEIRSEYLPLARHHGIDVRIDLDKNLQVRADPDALRRMLFNLLENATKFSPEGTLIRISAIDGQPGRTLIRVDDAGPGVPSAQRARIWDMYGRSDGNDLPGSGIGLSLVRHYVERHDGTVWVEDAPNGGARFVLDFPAGKDC